MKRSRNRALLATASGLLAAIQLTGCGGDPQSRSARSLERGNRYFDQQKYREAAIEYQNAVQADGRSGTARRRLAAIYERLNQLSKARDEYIRAADLIPEDAALQLTAGAYLLAAGRFDDARNRAEAALRVQPSNVQAHVLLGNALAGLRDVDQAVTEIEQAIRIDPARGATYAHLGLLQMSLGRAEAAEAAFKRCVALAPAWVPGHLALANHYWATGKRIEAERTLHVALQLEPANPLANRVMALFLIASNRPTEAEGPVKALAASGAAPFALADFYLLQNRPHDAIAELRQLRDGRQTTRGVTWRLAQAYAVLGNLSDALRLVDELLKNEPRDADSLLLKGQLLAQQGNRNDALVQLKAAADVDPTSARVQFALGRSYAASGDFDRARTAYNEVLKANPRAAGVQVELSRLELATGRIDNSVRLARDAARNAPKSLPARLSVVRALLASNDLAAAEKALAPLLAAAPNESAVHVQRGLALLARHDSASARHSFEHALELDSESFEALNALTTLDAATGHYALAKTRIEARLENQPNRTDLLMLAARASVAARDLPAAEGYLRRAIQADTATLAAYAMLGHLYVVQRKLGSARHEFEELARRQVNPISAITMLGILAHTEGDIARSQKYYEEVMTMDPDAPVAANNLAWLYAEQRTNLDAALELALKASQALPEAAEVQDTLGWVYYQRQTAGLAVEAFRNTVKLAPSNALYHYHLGLAHAQDGNIVGARGALQTALRLNPSFAQGAEARRLLDQLSAPPRAR